VVYNDSNEDYNDDSDKRTTTTAAAATTTTTTTTTISGHLAKGVIATWTVQSYSPDGSNVHPI